MIKVPGMKLQQRAVRSVKPCWIVTITGLICMIIPTFLLAQSWTEYNL